MKRQMKTDKDRKPDRDRHSNRERQTAPESCGQRQTKTKKRSKQADIDRQ